MLLVVCFTIIFTCLVSVQGSVNDDINCWSTNGYWRQGSPHIVNNRACSRNRYSENRCAQLTRNSSGIDHVHYHYGWEVGADRCERPFEPWSLENACNLLAGETVMMVGDSLQEEFHFSLLAATWTYDSHDEQCNPAPIRTINCKGHSFRISFYRNDYLTLTTTNTDTEHAWANQLEKENTTILIMNRGAHYIADDEFMSSLRSTMTYLRKYHRNIQIYYRSTAAGHLDFNSRFDSMPLTKYSADVAADSFGETFHYSSFAHQNNLTRLLLTTEFPEIVYFDIYGATVLRADSHPDPLHYCIPGPIDQWVLLWYNALLLRKSTVVVDTTIPNIPYDSKKDPILQQWADFNQNSSNQCGNFANWMNKYKQFHASVVSQEPISDTSRVFVSLSGGQGATDRLVGHLTGLFAAILSNRAYVLDTMDTELTFSHAFDDANLNTTIPKSLHMDVHYHWSHSGEGNDFNTQYSPENKFAIVKYTNGYHMFDASYPSWAQMRINGVNPVVVVASNRGGLYDLMSKSSNYSHIFREMKLESRFCVYCVFHYIFTPKPDVLQLAYPFSSQLVTTDSNNNNIIKIGIQIRTGDISFDQKHPIDADYLTKYLMYFQCAEKIERQVMIASSGGANGNASVVNANDTTVVRWYLMSDSLPLRIAAKKRYGNKLITDTQSQPFHTSRNKAGGGKVMHRIMAEILTISLCDYFVLTHDSGVGKFGAWLSPTRKPNSSFISGSNHHACDPYNEETMAHSNQGL